MLLVTCPEQLCWSPYRRRVLSVQVNLSVILEWKYLAFARRSEVTSGRARRNGGSFVMSCRTHALKDETTCVGGGTYETVSSLPCYSCGSPGAWLWMEAVSCVEAL